VSDESPHNTLDGGFDTTQDSRGAGRPRARRRKPIPGAGIGVAAIGLVTVLVLTETNVVGAKSSAVPDPTPSGFHPSATTPAGDAQETAEAFLSAWQGGRLQQAADATDDPSAALSTLSSFESGLHLNGLTLTARTATATGSVTFAIAAKVGLPPNPPSSRSTATAQSAAATATASAQGTPVTAAWDYMSKLIAYKKNRAWWIKWSPSLVAPKLTASERLVSLAIQPGVGEVTDNKGGNLAAYTDAGLRNIAAALKQSAPTSGGVPGVEVELESLAGTPVGGSEIELSRPVDSGVVGTTFDPKVQAAAQAAVARHADSSMVAIQPTTGDILAVANNDGGNDFALTARIAPGSTNKIITSTALLADGLLASDETDVQCPASLTIDGTVFKNSQGESLPAGTPFLDDFAESCNDAFARWYDKIGDSTLAETAQKYYGLNEDWNLGTGAAGPYYTLPASASNGELAQELFGQGRIVASPLAMASVAATADVRQSLWQMMQAVVSHSDGTAYGVFNGVRSTVYGKTGTADVSGTQQNPNSWMVVFDPTLDIAIGCVVLDAGYGASFAGPEEASVLTALQ
jgi:hypothetical protein